MLLKEYFKLHDVDYKEFAKEVQITKFYVYQLLSRTRKPGRKLAQRIEDWTNGSVTKMELLYPEDFEQKV